MHGTLFLGFEKATARSSMAARRWACDYLSEEGFTPMRRFGGAADYYGVGGRSSGILEILRLRHERIRTFEKFWKALPRSKDPVALFKRSFPSYRGRIPVARDVTPDYGYADDAQIIDETLYHCLKPGFANFLEYSCGIDEKLCVLYCGTSESGFEEWPKTKEAIIGRTWIVVIDYHT